MKLAYEPTLTEIRDMLGEELYVKFVWMWREQEQERVTAERRAKWAAVLPERQVAAWPTPVFVRAEETREPLPVPTAAQAFQAALLRPARVDDSINVGELAGFLDRVGAHEEDVREVAMGGRRRRR